MCIRDKILAIKGRDILVLLVCCGKTTFAGQIVGPQANTGKHAEKAGRIVQRSALVPVIDDNVNIAISRSYVCLLYTSRCV